MVDFDNMQRWDSDGKWQTENARIYQQFMQFDGVSGRGCLMFRVVWCLVLETI
jgi:hypothetical protein